MARQPDSTITVKLVGTPAATRDLRLDDFIEEMQTLRTALRETERAVSGRDPSLYFRIKKLQKSSPALIVLEAASETENAAERQFASAVVRSFATNLQLIRRRQVPDNIDVPTLESYRELALPMEKHQLEVQIQIGRKQETCWPSDVTKGIEQIYAKQIVVITSVISAWHNPDSTSPRQAM